MADSRVVYLDNAATTPVRPEVVEEMIPYFTENYGNPSGIYRTAAKAKQAVAQARQTIASTINAKPECIYFTAGGSESDNWALKGIAESLASVGKHIITTKIEHHAILNTCSYLEKQGFDITYLDVNENGLVNPDVIERTIRPDTILISVMLANNEIGTIQPVEQIGKIAREAGVLFHTDAVQAYTQIPIDVQAMNIDLMSTSGHKINGPKGIGFLYIREEQVDTETHAPTHYTETSLFYDHVKYKIDGYKKTTTWTKIGKGTGKPPKNIDEDEQITYSGDEWTLSRGTTTTSHVASEKSDKDGDLIANEHLTESYDDYSVDETYTRQEVFNYTIIVDSSTRNYKYDIDISEIDCWYLLYDRPYAEPTKNIKEYDKPDDVKGQYPQTTSSVEGVSAGATNAANAFLEKKKNQFANSYPEANVIEGSITAIRTEKKSKTDGVVGDDYKATRTTYEFGDESSIDTTQVQFKNLEYLNNKPSYTPNGKMGLLYIYDKYIKAGEDLCLQNDAEKELFELLEDDANTTHISDIMRFLLYVYDGLERGVTDLDKTFKVVDMSLTDYYSIAGNAFGCNISRDEFITKAQSYGKSILADLAPLFYDICSKYNVNPCVAYGWAALESGWGKSAVEDKNLFQMGSYNGSSSGFSYDSYEDSIESFCKWVVNAADPSSSAYSQNQERAKEYATVNSKFDGTPDKNIYALFSRYSWVGYTHTGNARACIKNTYNFLNNGVYECNHADSDETTLKERADYMQYQVDLRLSIAEDVFKTKILLSNKGDFTSIDNIIIGISNDDESQFSGGYSSSFGRKYIEWIQGAGLIGQQPLFDSGATMGSAGCHVYACGTLASSTGIEPSIWEVWDIYKHKAGNEAYVRTIEMVLDLYGVDAKVCTGNAWNQEDVISVLKSGKGVMIYVKNGYGNLYTKKVHWITLADIRETQLNSGIGYDIYALTSNNGSGHGWHPIETVLKNLAGPNFFYIEDGKTPNKVKKGDTYEEF